MIGLLVATTYAQRPTPKPTPPPSELDVGCSLEPELIKIRVSVWDKKKRDFLTKFDHRDFEIRIDDEPRDIDYFIRPRDPTMASSLPNEYIIGLAMYDLPERVSHRIKVGLKRTKGVSGLIIEYTPREYIH